MLPGSALASQSPAVRQRVSAISGARNRPEILTEEAILNELRQEADTAKRLLDRVPGDKLAWRPHPKSMSLGQLALHVANIPGDLNRLAQLDQLDAAKANFEPAMPESKEAVVNAFRKSLSDASELSGGTFPGYRPGRPGSLHSVVG
jgi:hypothetical protein